VRSSSRYSYSFLSVLLLIGASAMAQDFRATLNGRVTDSSGGSIPGVTVQVRNTRTNETTTVITDDQGNYNAPLLKPGTYSISAEQTGFKKFQQDGIELSINQVATANIALEVGQLTDQVTVTAGVEILELSTANRGSVIDNQQVREFPLNARNPFMLGMLVAGVNFNGASIWQRPFDNGAIAEWTINGSQSRGNEFLLDGAPNNGQAGGNNIALVPPVDSVEEFKIQTNTYDAQYGKTTGGIINVSLRSGGNDFHGTLYEFARREQWDANDFRINARNQPKPLHYLDQYGGQIQGPVIFPKLYNGRDKTFFMFNYEGYREGVPAPLTLSVPEAEMLNGDFSKLVDAQGRPVIIYDPLTGRADASAAGGWVRDPFPGNVIPQTRINPISQKILSFQPKPNTKSPDQGYSRANLFIPDNIAGDDFYNWVLKIDQNIGSKHRIFGRYAENDRTEDRNVNGIFEGPGQDGQQPFKRINHAFVFDHVGTMGPTFIFNYRFSFNRFEEHGFGRGNLGFDKTALGFPKSMVDQIPHGDLFGRYEFTDYNSLGRYQSRNITNTWAIHPNLNKIKGAHTLKAGVDIRWTQYIEQNQGNPFRLQANRGFTQRVWNQGETNSGDSIASFLIGLPFNGLVDNNLYPTTLWNYYAPWFQDDWKVTRRLTLNLGLRWDFNFAPNERFDRINRGFDFTAVNPVDAMIDRTRFPGFPTVRGGLLFAGVDGQPRTVGNLDKNNIQPRIGGAYQISQKLVLRAGWGIYYVNPNNNYLEFRGFSQSTNMVDSLDGGRTPRSAQLINDLFPTGIQVPSGSSLGLMTFLGRNPQFFNPEFEVPYVHQFSLGFQYELPWSSKIEVAYVGNRTMRLQTERQFNEPDLAMRQRCNPLEGGSPAFCDERLPNPFFGLEPFRGTTLFSSDTVSRWDLARPYPQFAGYLERGRNDGQIWYNSGQVTFEKRTKNSLNMIATYTFSKQIEQWGFTDVQQNLVQRGLYLWDRAHRFTVGSVYQLPFGPGRRFLSGANGFWGKVLEGWENNIIFQWQSGRPWDLSSSNRTNLMVVRDAKDPDPDWRAPKVFGVRTSTNGANTAACVANMNDNGVISLYAYSVAAGCTDYDFLRIPRYAPGSVNTGRMTPFRDGRIRLHAVPSIDFSLNKTTRISEGTSIQFRFEAFNFTNTYEYGGRQFNNNPDDPNFGSIFPRDGGNTETRYPRHIQLAVKFIF
jgi:Carboxypeptidase regulatory-like domain